MAPLDHISAGCTPFASSLCFGTVLVQMCIKAYQNHNRCEWGAAFGKTLDAWSSSSLEVDDKKNEINHFVLLHTLFQVSTPPPTREPMKVPSLVKCAGSLSDSLFTCTGRC